MDKKYIQLPRFITHREKRDAILLIENEINRDVSEYKDGENIVIEYVGPDGNQMYSTATIRIDENDIAKIYVSVEENETLRIVDTEEEPADKSVIWLTESEDSEEDTPENLKKQISDLKEELRALKEIIEKHDYALSNTIAGGDIITNSEKYREESEHDPEQPEDAVYVPVYTDTDFTVADFDLYLGNSPFYDYYQHTALYKGQRYQLKPRFFNAAGEAINPDDLSGYTVVEISVVNYGGKHIADFYEQGQYLLATDSGNTGLVAELELENGSVLRKDYDLNFEYNEEPYYERYGEPNVHHLLIKEAATQEILMANANYLCVNELIWCIGNNSLYIKAKNNTGGISLFKINGNGGSIDPDTGSTTGDTTGTTEETVTFYVENDTLYAVGEPLSVENGVFNIPVATVTDGVLNLLDVN